jgi:GT2 family glycosyltransferase
MQVSIDIVILNYNTKNLLQLLVPVVMEYSEMPGVKVVIADNASTDGSAEWVRENLPELECIVLSKNLGYAGGYNEVLKNRKADYFILLNSDAEPAPGWLEPLIEMIRDFPDLGTAQPKLLDFYQRNKFEYAGASGGFLDHYGYPFCRGRIFGHVEIDHHQYNNSCEIFWATGACFLVKREAWEKANGLDMHFFAHMEEIDLCWRLQLLGYKNYVCPESIVYHMGGGTLSNLSPRKTFLNFRNNLLMLYKNLHPSEKNKIIFRRKLLDGLAACFFILQGKWRHIPQVWKAHRAYEKMKQNAAISENPKLLADFKTVMKSGLVWNFFAKGKRTFSSLKF